MPLAMLEGDESDKALMDAIRNETAPPEETPPEPPKAEEPAPAPEAKAPEPALAPTPPVEPAKPAEPPVSMVPLPALHEERQRRKELERRLAELEKPKPAAIPDETQDPIGTIAALKQQNEQFAQILQQQREEQIYAGRAQSKVQAYAQQHPEYNEQANFLHNFRIQQMRIMGTPEDQIVVRANEEAKQLFRWALDNDRDPAQMVAELAITSGWKPAAAPAAPAAPAPAPAPAPPKPPIQESEETIERLERGRRAAISSSSGGGAPPASEELALDRIVELEGAAFDKAVAKFMAREKANGNWR